MNAFHRRIEKLQKAHLGRSAGHFPDDRELVEIIAFLRANGSDAVDENAREIAGRMTDAELVDALDDVRAQMARRP